MRPHLKTHTGEKSQQLDSGHQISRDAHFSPPSHPVLTKCIDNHHLEPHHILHSQCFRTFKDNQVIAVPCVDDCGTSILISNGSVPIRDKQWNGIMARAHVWLDALFTWHCFLPISHFAQLSKISCQLSIAKVPCNCIAQLFVNTLTFTKLTFTSERNPVFCNCL